MRASLRHVSRHNLIRYLILAALAALLLAFLIRTAAS